MNNIRDDLLRTVDRICDEHCSVGLREAAERGQWPTTLWAAMIDVGLDKAALPESSGGVGLEFGDAMAILGRVAWHAAPIPLAETMLAGRLLSSAGIAVPDGPLCVVPDGRRLALDAQGRVSGAASRVPWADQCEHVVAAVTREGQSFLVLMRPDGASCTVERNLGGESRVTLAFGSQPTLACTPFDEAHERVLVDGALCRSVQMAGALRRILDYSVRYANERIQFGKPIAKFQAVQHMLALLAGHCAAASAACNAAVGANEESVDRFSVAVAKARVGEAAGKGAEIAHQVHAAMGFTREHPLHFSTRSLWAWREEFGSERYWQEWLGRLVARGGADALWPMLTAAGERGAHA